MLLFLLSDYFDLTPSFFLRPLGFDRSYLSKVSNHSFL
jgi:hypothetical protein